MTVDFVWNYIFLLVIALVKNNTLLLSSTPQYGNRTGVSSDRCYMRHSLNSQFPPYNPYSSPRYSPLYNTPLRSVAYSSGVRLSKRPSRMPFKLPPIRSLFFWIFHFEQRSNALMSYSLTFLKRSSIGEYHTVYERNTRSLDNGLHTFPQLGVWFYISDWRTWCRR